MTKRTASRLMPLLLTPLLLLFVLGMPIVQAQSDDALPPHVIDVYPLPGVELALDEPLVITFDQPMNPASVEQGLTFSPEVSGRLSWVEPRVLRFIPDGGWQRGAQYTATIGANATAENGAALEQPYSFDVKIVGTLLVAAVAPEPGTQGAAADSRIVVTFDRPVVPLVSTEDSADLPNPLTLEPAVEGKGAWVNTSIYVFTPSESLAGGTTYTATIPGGLTSAGGALMEDAYTWTFRTLPPQILSISPTENETGVLLDTPVTVRFSQPMDRASTEAAFSVQADGVAVPGSARWTEDDTVLTFIPSNRLELETTYVVNIAPTAKGAFGKAALDSGLSQSFTTLPFPRVVSTIPGYGEAGVSLEYWYAVTISFSSPMDNNSFKDKIRVEPEPDNLIVEVSEWAPNDLRLNFDKDANTTYTITLLAGAEDIYGNAISTDYVLSFTTADITPNAYPIINGDFMLTGAYREHTRFGMMITGAVSVSYELYRLNIADMQDTVVGSFNDYIFSQYALNSAAVPPWVTEDNLLRAWSSNYDTRDAVNVPYEVLLASDDGGQLAPGLYWVIVDSSVQSWLTGDSSFQFALAVSDNNVTVKRAPDETLVWVTDMQSAQPVANSAVTIYHNGEPVASGTTDADGIFRASVSLQAQSDSAQDIDQNWVYLPDEAKGENIYVETINENGYGAWYSQRDSDLPTERGYLYTDRPVYRPGETVYYRGVLRARRDMDYRVPDINTVNVTIGENYGERVYFEGVVEVNDFGTFNGEFVIPDDAPLGEIYIRAAYGDSEAYQYGAIYPVWTQSGDKNFSQVIFNVTEFRVPEFEVSVTAQQESIIQGDTLNALADVSYYAGGKVSNAFATYSAYGERVAFDYQGAGSYSFYNEGEDQGYQSYFYQEFIPYGTEGTTDANGELLISVPSVIAEVPAPYRITVEASVSDESGQTISGRASAIAHPADIYVGLDSDNYFGSVDTPSTIHLITVSPESAPIGGRTVDLELVRTKWTRTPIEGQFGRYEWTEERSTVETAQTQTGADGTGSYIFTPEEAGSYLIRATVKDDAGRLNVSTLRLYVFGGQQAVFWGQPSSWDNSVTLTPDKSSYKPGDTARILVPLPFEGASTVMVSADRADIMAVDVVQADGSTLVYDLPITSEFAPTVYVNVIALKGIDAQTPNPTYVTGTVQLDVEPVEDRLTVEVTPSERLAPPRGTVAFDLHATDADGSPVQAEIGVALTDKAVLALMEPNSATLEAMFYGRQSNYVNNTVGMSALLDVLTDGLFPLGRGGGGGGEGGGGGIFVRENFVYTPLWAPNVVTDAEGNATVSVELPDNLTTWKLDARAVTLQTQVGQAETEIISTLPLQVRPVAPRFFVVGDRIVLAAVVNNNTDDTQTVEVSLGASGVTLENSATQTVTIDSGGRARVEWLAVADDVPGVDLIFTAIGENGAQDAARPALRTGPDDTIPVYRYTAPDTVGTGGILTDSGANVEAISLPPRLTVTEGDLTVRLDPSLAAATVDSLDYLRSFPHQCTEQTISRFLPNVVTYRALRDLGIQNAELETNLNTTLAESLDRLIREQNANGSWSWFPGMEYGDPLVTAYAALGLLEARAAGFAVDQTMIDSALNFIQLDFVQPDANTPPSQLNRQAFYAYVLARGGKLTQNDLASLFTYRLNLARAGTAYLLMAAHEIAPGSQYVAPLIGDLTNSAAFSATGAHWQEADDDWYNWGSDTRTTALALNALVRADPQNPLLPNVVRWLMVARQGDHWQTTQETAWSVMTLTDWMVLTGELQGNYNFTTRFNDVSLADGTVTSQTVQDAHILRVQVSDMLKDTVNRLTVARFEGTGALYYSAFLNLRLPADQVSALDRGISVSRQYFLSDAPEEAITSAQVGDIITVRLTITLPEDIYYFALEDPIPAGTEALDTSLLTTTTQSKDPTLRTADPDDPYWYWGWWWFDHTELRDEQTNLYADYLPRGTYVYSYQVRATIPGEFQTMPAQAYAFYMPDVFGRTDGSLFTIAPDVEE